MLEALNAPHSEHFAPAFLDQIPLQQVQPVLNALQRRHGVARAVTPLDASNMWTVQAERGQYEVLARFDDGGRLSGLRVPTPAPGAGRIWVWRAVRVTLIFLALVGNVLSWAQPTQLAWLGHVPAVLLLSVALLPTTVWAELWTGLRVLLICGVIGTVLSASRAVTLPLGGFALWDSALTLVAALLLLPLIVQAKRGRKVPGDAVGLGPVVAGGRFVVAHGGSTAALNYHAEYPAMRYAVDLIGVGPLGHHARGLWPQAPAKYVIFGAQVLAPLPGRVLAVEDGHPDLRVPETDPLHPAGNHVLLACLLPDGREVQVLLAHLQHGSVRVRPGEVVRAGQGLGRVGNSGNTSEPHLHLGVNMGGADTDVFGGEGVPFTIDGRFPVRGMTFTG
ncbi:M23 family metallopeptidase [Deinococcus planocerae]|uniref:M23 family metallopeptidase n=1 Tax=Deinococcus planocerae TaxID=1737569 RepID=UPI000C7F43BF|nr:M23 family metallopeptidase [Deinococcus planocerae]